MLLQAGAEIMKNFSEGKNCLPADVIGKFFHVFWWRPPALTFRDPARFPPAWQACPPLKGGGNQFWTLTRQDAVFKDIKYDS
jgi:hypothetical protein